MAVAKIKIPTNQNDITLIQVMTYNSSALDRIGVVKTFCSGDVNELSLDEADLISATVLELLNDGHPVFNPFVTINDVTYGFNPNLRKMSVSEFVDLDEYCKTPNTTAHNAMSVLYRPITMRIGKKYTIEKYSDTRALECAEELKHMPFDLYRGAIAFFLICQNHCMNNLSKYSNLQWKQLASQGVIAELKTLLEISGDGTTPL